MKHALIITSVAACFALASCSGNKKGIEVVSQPDSLIAITQQQFDTDKMEFGEPQQMPFGEIVQCNGNIVVKPSGWAKISALVPGLVQSIYCSTGQKVSRGQVLFELSGNELIELQRELAESASQLARLKSEFDRTKELFADNVGTQKDFISAESEYNIMQANYAALKLKIGLIGLDASKVESGHFYASYSIKSPINGYISQINLSIGQHAVQEMIMAEIFDVSQFQIQLAVFEKDITQLLPGQKIKFRMLENIERFNTATLRAIGKNVDNASKTITCFADIDDVNSSLFVNNAFVEAQIITKTDSVSAIQTDAILKSNNQFYILKLGKLITAGVYNVQIE